MKENIMDQGRKKARKRVIVIFWIYLCIALVCIGIGAYLVIVKRTEGAVNDRLVTLSKILVFAGIFFLIMDFGHILPSLFSHNKIRSEANMRQVLSKYIPCDETLLAGIYASVQQSKVKAFFGKCRCEDGKLVPDENGGVLSLDKEKYAAYEVYLGITQSHLLVVECTKNKHCYSCTIEPDIPSQDVQELSAELNWEDIGNCFLLEDVQNFEVKKGSFGSTLCTLTMKNGTYFKLLLPYAAGPNGDMPHHTEYLEAILARLRGTKCNMQ